jgi:hypothetical protein
MQKNSSVVLNDSLLQTITGKNSRAQQTKINVRGIFGITVTLYFLTIE